MREFGPVPADRAIFLLRQVCHSLADAHARGMVHRDIKPANIYVCRMGLEYDFVKVLDFGLVKVRDRGRRPRHARDAWSTPPPGRRRTWRRKSSSGEADVDRRADVYALGCVAYFLLTGQLVFEADTPMKMLMQHVHATPVPPSQRTELPDPARARRARAGVPREGSRGRGRRTPRSCSAWRCGCKTCETWNQTSARELVADAPARPDGSADAHRS